MADHTICDACGREIPPHAHYIVRIEVFADPSLPSTTSKELLATDFDAEMQKILDEVKNLSADELQDQVHRQFEYTLCRSCHRKYLANPLGDRE